MQEKFSYDFIRSERKCQLTVARICNKMVVVGRFQLNLHHVISFYSVAKEQSFSRASEQLSITQPAVTQHIHGLEMQFGVRLVNVKGKQVRLTKAGERFLPYAEELFTQAVTMENFLKGYRFSNISIGISSSLLLYLTPLIDKFKQLHPSIRLSIREGRSLLLAEELLDCRHDICLVGLLPFHNERLHVYRIPRNEQTVFVASPEYPLPIDEPITWAQLISCPLIIPSEGSAARVLVLHHFKKRGLKALIGAEVDNIEFAKELARQKKGLAIMFEPNIRDEVDRGTLRIVQVHDCDMKIGGIDVLINKETLLSPAAEKFVAVLKEHFSGNLYEMPSR